MAVTQEPGQPEGAAVHERDPPSPAVDTEDGVLRRHPQVAPGGQLQPSRHGVALHRGDDRFRNSMRVGPTGPSPSGSTRTDPGQPRFAHRFEIGAGTEGAARSGQHRDVLAVVGVEVPKDIGERGGGGTVDGVGDLGTVERDDRHRAVGGDVHGHGAPRGVSSRRGWRPST